MNRPHVFARASAPFVAHNDGSGMKLVMFDMDGTLTDGFSLEENCYVLAIEQALGLENVVTDWESYTHTSSSFCLQEIVRVTRGHPPTPAESAAVQRRMIALMDEIHARKGRRTQEIPGAADCVRALQAAGYAVAIASGDWEATARHKLTSARIPFADLPAAFCDCAHARTEIMTTALRRAAETYACESFERIVYVGDGAWDVRACRDLGWPLIGVGHGAHAHRLRALGTTHVIADYSSLETVFSAVEQAGVPAAPARQAI